MITKRVKISALLIAVAIVACSLCACLDKGVGESASVKESASVSSSISSSASIKEKTDVRFLMSVEKNSAGYAAIKNEVSPLIYGEFLEHISGCIYGAIWSELLMDRKFYYPVGEDGLSPWKVSGTVDSSTDRYSDNGYAALLSEDSSFSQRVELIKKDYDGYFYAKGGGTVTVAAGGESFSFVTGEDYKKYTFSFTSGNVNASDVTFGCLSGTVYVDSVSLMPADNYNGIRRDTLDAMKSLGGTVYRWPGGNFVSGYDWKNGIGDRDKRVCERNKAWFPDTGNVESDKKKLADGDFYARIEPNDMGTEEFLSMCEYIGATPYIAVNTGSGSVQDAVDLVNYLNSTTTSYGLKRIAGGHASPYNVKYFCVGNEMQGDWQIGHTSIDNYVKIHNAFVTAMRKADKNIIVTGCGDNYSDWSEGMIKNCAANLDYIGEHLYAERSDDNDLQRHILKTLDNFSMRIDKHRALIKKYPAAKDVKIAFDEYAYNWNGKPDMRDALGIAATLNLFIENADVVGMANYSDAVFNVTKVKAAGAMFADKSGVTFSPVGYVLKAYAENMCPYGAGVTVRKTDGTIDLYYKATASHDGRILSVAFVNASDRTVGIDMRDNYTLMKKVCVYSDDERSTTATYTVTTSQVDLVVRPLGITVFVMQIE